jgi:hypothetical protein
MTFIDLKKRIMIRVYALYALRKAREPFIAELLLLMFCMTLLSFFVSLSHVMANTPRDVGGFSNFLFVAVRDTRLVVQAILLSMLVAFGLLIRNSISRFSNVFRGRFQIMS